MVQKSGVNVHIGSEFDAKGFKQAQTALSKLSGSAKKLAGAVGLAYGAKALVAYGKASMKAAADDQKAQKILASNLKNVGLAYASVDAESFISSMEKQTAILDDQLRPAYSQLATTTGSVTKTQELMALAFDVSSGSGLDYSTTVDILTQAYVGNTKGLKQLNLGLTQAELKTMSFAQIQEKLKANFAGAGGASLDSYAGSMAKLSVATNNASETIGTALLDAIIKVSGSNGIDGLISKIDTLAKSFASVVTQVGNAISALTGTAAQKAFSPGYYVGGGKAGGKTVAPTGAGNMAMSVLSQDTQKSDLAAKKKAEADAVKRQKELLALQKKQLVATKQSAALSAAQKKFGLQAISIEAALKATYDKETILRLKALQAIEADNGELALEYLSKINDLTKLTDAQKLAGIKGISEANLLSLNTTLLAELTAIDKTKMAEADKDLARQAAFSKYNDALVKQGGLQDLNYYNEKVQIQLNSIAKLAALKDYGSAEVTLNTILNANVKAIETAQSKADISRFNALVAYIAKLDDAKNAALALAEATAAAAAATVNGINAIGAAQAKATADAAAAAAASAAAAAAASSGGILGETVPKLTDPNYGGAFGGSSKDAKDARDASASNSSTTVIVNTGSVLGTEQTIVDAVQTALQTINRYGNSSTYAGAI